MQVKPLASFLIDTSALVRGNKRNTIITTILLISESPELTSRCLQNTEGGAARIDEDLVLGLYAAGDRKIRLALARSPVLCRLPPRSFRKIFDEVYGRADLTVMERQSLTWQLDGFLRLNPRQALSFERTILELLRSPRLELRARALPLVGLLDQLDAPTLALLTRNLKARNPSLRVNALGGFHRLIERRGRLAPHVRDFLASAAFRAQVSELCRSDPDEMVRHNARSVLHALGRARGRAGRPR